MVLHATVYTGLVTTTLGVAAFRLSLSYTLKNVLAVEVLSATAAYAAVSVVFVGLNNS